ncbi:MAG: YbhB/YbcL family Raf kinase inhibitor-like protein [Candidatus Eremiobacteraeota bacterium]|nr:YbhB/YbcL family Raf kinase inhibitor-like protein [Candidatus Eremiobacteraeota bacterium]
MMRVPISLAIAFTLCIAGGIGQAGPARIATLPVGSSTFRNNATVPDRMVATSCHGQNVSPELHWSATKQVQSYALTAWDPDAPAAGGWWHWVLYDIPRSAHHIAEGQSAGASGTTSSNSTGYDGPCPPPGPAHHYRFTVYALNVAHIGATPQTTGPQLLIKMHAHVLAKGVAVGLYKR